MIKFINYTKEQRSGMAVTGYSLYVNGSHCYIVDTVTSAKTAAHRYPNYNEIEIYPVLKRRY